MDGNGRSFCYDMTNMMSGDEIHVRLRTMVLLESTAGAYEFVFPLDRD